MGLLDSDSLGAPARKVMVLFYLIDTSGSMSGAKIGTVNAALEEVLPDLEGISKANDDAEIKVAVMTFSSGFEWVTENGPVSITDAQMLVGGGFEAGGLTDLGAACLELDKKLSRNEFMKSATGAFAPVILLFSDGAPTDNFQDALVKLKENMWFKLAIKIAIAINDGDNKADTSVLKQFTNSTESVLEASDRKTLKKLIRTVSVRASQFQSHSKNAEKETSVEEDAARIIKDIQVEIEEEKASGADTGSSDDSWGDWGDDW
jgi:uncharacterized protein YegL